MVILRHVCNFSDPFHNKGWGLYPSPGTWSNLNSRLVNKAKRMWYNGTSRLGHKSQHSFFLVHWNTCAGATVQEVGASRGCQAATKPKLAHLETFRVYMKRQRSQIRSQLLQPPSDLNHMTDSQPEPPSWAIYLNWQSPTWTTWWGGSRGSSPTRWKIGHDMQVKTKAIAFYFGMPSTPQEDF